MRFLDFVSWPVLIAAALLLGLAPFFPKPHLVEKVQMLLAGTLERPIDIFDLCLHMSPLVLMVLKLLRARSS